jgi:hypothetical protein
MARLAPAVPEADRAKPYQLKRTIGRIAWVSATVVLTLGVLAFASGRGFSLTASQGGPSIEVDGLAGAVAPEQIDRSQPQLEAERTEANAEIADEPPTATAVDIAGEWFGDSSGATYLIEQVGDAATITEFDAFDSITAVGQGALSGDRFSFTYDSAAGIVGFGELVLDPTGTFLNGFWEDGFGRRPAQLSRL